MYKTQHVNLLYQLYNRINILSILLLTAFLANATYAGVSEDLHIENSYLAAKQKAEELGRPYIVQFTANWCTPCVWHDETILKDRKVVQTINENYVFVRMDIEKFEGYSIKEYFQVNNIPAILIFSEKHELLSRVAGPMDRIHLLSLLNSLQEPGERTPISVENSVSRMVNRSAPPHREIGRSSAANYNDRLEESVRPEAPYSFGGQVYAIQVGAYSTIENAQARELEVQGLSNEETFITRQDDEDRRIYKVYVGHFDSRGQVELVRKRLCSLEIKGWTKKITLTEKI